MSRRRWGIVAAASAFAVAVVGIASLALKRKAKKTRKSVEVDAKQQELSSAVVRAQFPFLQGEEWAMLENAGGSAVPKCVADAVHSYYLNDYVQLTAGYPASQRATSTVDEAHDLVALLMNAPAIGKVVLGSSTSTLCQTLADAYSNASLIKPGDEIVISEEAHESNAGPWMKLAAKTGATLRVWPVDRSSSSAEMRLEDLKSLLSERTRIMAFPHVSNLVGECRDVASVVRAVRAASPRARVVVDGVAYAPHRAIDVQAWDCDFYVFSTYKVYGPHMGALYGKTAALEELVLPNHFFIPKSDIVHKFELGGCSHEGCAAIVALRPYLNLLAGERADAKLTRSAVERAFGVMERLERPLTRRLLTFLGAPALRGRIRVIGPVDPESKTRVPTISFVHKQKPASEIVAACHAKKLAVRNGHMYAFRLCEALGISTTEGVVRVSMVHYNTEEEVERLIAVLEKVL